MEYHVIKAKISSLTFDQRSLLEKEITIARENNDIDSLYELETNYINAKFDIAMLFLGDELAKLYLNIEAGVRDVSAWPSTVH